MKRKITFLLLQIILAGSLFVGLLLVWASLQTYETLALLFNKLASDGELETFTVFLYQILRLPIALVGTCLAILAGFLLVRWKKTELWIQVFPGQVKYFFKMLRKDTQNLVNDVKTAFVSQGWINNAILFGLMFVALVIRLGNLDIPLSHDEAYMYNAFASRSIWHIVSNYHLPNIWHVLYQDSFSRKCCQLFLDPSFIQVRILFLSDADMLEA